MYVYGIVIVVGPVSMWTNRIHPHPWDEAFRLHHALARGGSRALASLLRITGQIIHRIRSIPRISIVWRLDFRVPIYGGLFFGVVRRPHEKVCLFSTGRVGFPQFSASYQQPGIAFLGVV